MSAKDDFQRDGYVLVPGALSADEVGRLRAFCTHLFASPPTEKSDLQNIRADIFCRQPEASWLLATPKVVATLREVFGPDFVYLPDLAVHDSYYGKKWHKDTTNAEIDGHDFHRAPDFRMAIIAIYLQDNGDFGGGLNVIPGTHMKKDQFVRFHTRTKWSFWRKVRYRLASYGLLPHEENPVITGDGTPVVLPTKAGDAVIFDLRISHKATAPKSEAVPKEHRKFAFFLSASANNAHVEEWLRFLMEDDGLLSYVKGHRYAPHVEQLGREHDLRFA